jgi:hypothetical protein
MNTQRFTEKQREQQRDHIRRLYDMYYGAEKVVERIHKETAEERSTNPAGATDAPPATE